MLHVLNFRHSLSVVHPYTLFPSSFRTCTVSFYLLTCLLLPVSCFQPSCFFCNFPSYIFFFCFWFFSCRIFRKCGDWPFGFACLLSAFLLGGTVTFRRRYLSRSSTVYCTVCFYWVLLSEAQWPAALYYYRFMAKERKAMGSKRWFVALWSG